MKPILFNIAVKIFPRIDDDPLWIMKHYSLYCFLHDPVHSIRFWCKYRLDKEWRKEIDDLKSQVRQDMEEFLAQYPND